MATDALVALGRATVDGQTLFGQNCARSFQAWQRACCTARRTFAVDDKVHTQQVELPQAREVYKVLGSQPDGCWGYDHGLNEHQVAAGWAKLRAALPPSDAGLLGTDLVRLALERSRTARQAVQVVTDLIGRHGQADGDHALLLADPTEAYAVETAGGHWVYQEIQEVRAQSEVRVVHQDWDRISQGLAAEMIAQGGWPADGSKLDFAGALKEDARDHSGALGRWGRATLLLQEQNGHIDMPFLRQVLSDHGGELETGADSLCRHRSPYGPATSASFVCRLHADPAALPLAWLAFGPPCSHLFFPMFLDGEVPNAYTEQASDSGVRQRLIQLDQHLGLDRKARANVRDLFSRLQARFDQETADFTTEGMALKKQGLLSDLQRQATLFMLYNWERFESALDQLIPERPLAPVLG